MRSWIGESIISDLFLALAMHLPVHCANHFKTTQLHCTKMFLSCRDWPLLCLLIWLHAQDPNSWFHWSPICTKGILMLQIQLPSSSFWSHFHIKTWCKCISFISNLTLSSFMSTLAFEILVFPMKSWPTLWSAFARDPILDWTFLTKLSWLNFLQMKSWPTLWSLFAREPILDWTFIRFGEGAWPTTTLFIGTEKNISTLDT